MFFTELLEKLKPVNNNLKEVPNEDETTTNLNNLANDIAQSPSSPQRVQDLLTELQVPKIETLREEIETVRKEIETLTKKKVPSKELLVNLTKKIKNQFIKMIKKETSDPFDLALKIYGLYSFIQIIYAEQPYLVEHFHEIFSDFASFLQISFSLYKILQPLLAHCVLISKFLNQQKQQLPKQVQLQLTSDETLDTLTDQKTLDTLNSTNIPSTIDLQKQPQVQVFFKFLYDNKVFKTLSYFGDYFLIVPNIVIALKRKTGKVMGNAAYLPFLYKELPIFLTMKITNFIDTVIDDVISPSFSPWEGGKQRRKKTRYYKRKSKQFKKKTLRKINNGSCIQTTEMMLSSYLNNNNSKPIIRGYSIQKKIIPDKKLISIHTNIISNKNIRKIKTQKKHKRNTKETQKKHKRKTKKLKK